MPTITFSPEDHIFQLAAAPASSTRPVVCFAARLSGLYRSADGGQTWELAYQNLRPGETLATTAVAISPNFVHEPAVFAGLNGALLRSYDGGVTWRPSRLASPPPAISALAISPQYIQDGRIFAGTSEDGVLASSDRGESWAAWNFGLLDLNILCLALSPDFAADETIYAGVESGLFRSMNGGRAWKEVPLPGSFDAVLSLAVSPRFAEDHTLFVGTENHGLLVSSDRGQSWRLASESTREQPVNSIILFPSGPNRLAILVLHGGGLLLSRNGGRTWKTWRARKLAGREASAILVLHGLQEGVLVGLDDGAISRL
jgi:photosystem II stability/assembly factor-like uncharacterized protein